MKVQTFKTGMKGMGILIPILGLVAFIFMPPLVLVVWVAFYGYSWVVEFLHKEGHVDIWDYDKKP